MMEVLSEPSGSLVHNDFSYNTIKRPNFELGFHSPSKSFALDTLDAALPTYQAVNIQQSIPTRDTVGGKGFFLHIMKEDGLPVPEFVCIDVSVGEAIEQIEIPKQMIEPYFAGEKYNNIAQIKDALHHKTADERETVLNKCHQLLKSEDFYQLIAHSTLAANIREFYYQLNPDVSCYYIPVIVRSSGVAEDSYGDAQAGKYDSMVKGSEDIVQTY